MCRISHRIVHQSIDARENARLYHFTLRSLRFVVPLSCDPSALIQVFTSMFKYDLHVKLRLGDLLRNWEHGDWNARKTLHKPIIILSWFPFTKRQIVQWSTTPSPSSKPRPRGFAVPLPSLGSVGRTAVKGQFWVDACGKQIPRWSGIKSTSKRDGWHNLKLYKIMIYDYDLWSINNVL